MNWQYLFSGYEDLVDDVINFFTSKATNPVLFEDIINKCKSNHLVSNNPNHDVWMKLGRLSLTNFVHYRSYYTRQKGIPITIVRAVLERLCQNHIIFQEQLFQNTSDPVYYLNEEIAQFFYSRGLIKNIIFGFSYIAERYKQSIFKIVVTTNEGRESIGTGFLFKFMTEKNILYNIVITNEHVAKYKKDLRVLDIKDNIIASWNDVVLSQTYDVAAIILETPVVLPSFHLYNDPKILDDIIIAGYPPVPTAKEAYQLVHKGEINSFVTDYWGNDYFLFSARTSPGNSGGPAINNMGMVVGMVTQQLFEPDALQTKGELPYYAAVPSRDILKFLNEECLRKILD